MRQSNQHRRRRRSSSRRREAHIVSWQLAVEKLLPGGDALARVADGKPVFLSRAVPGDQVHVVQALDEGSYYRATEYRLIDESPLRVTPSCGHYHQCGGCDWMALAKPAQRLHKQELLKEALRRTGGFELEKLPDLNYHEDLDVGGYRRKLRLGISGKTLGYRRPKSHQLVPLSHCEIARMELSVLLNWLAELVKSHPMMAEHAYELELALLGSTLQLHVFVKRMAAPKLRRFRQFFIEQQRLAPQKFRLSFSTDDLRKHLYRLPLIELNRAQHGVDEKIWTYLPAGGFMQVNENGNQQMIQTVLAAAKRVGAQSFLDVYCGAGNFSFPLAALGLSGVGVEFEPLAIAGAQRAAKEQRRALEFHAGDAAQFVQRLLREERSFDLIVIDPPRSGAKDLLPWLERLRHQHLAYISCDPVTFARDLSMLRKTGFELLELAAFDLFPETHHVESFALLRSPVAPNC